MQLRTDTLPNALKAAARQTNPRAGYTFLEKKNDSTLTYADLLAKATAVAGNLQRQLNQEDRVILVLPTGEMFATIFAAIQLSGAIPCVLPSPALMREQKDGLRRIQQVAVQLQASLLITTETELDQWDKSHKLPVSVQTVENIFAQEPRPYQPVTVSPDDIALIQATSGSTSAPKCVALTHTNVLSNLEQIGQHLQVNEEDVVVSWLPLFHDMGLIGCFLFVLYWQLPGVFMAPYQFLRRPVSWLQAITTYKGTLSPAPNFAYALTADRTPDSALAELDLSSWRSAMCGAEPIDPRTLSQFAERFAARGFYRAALTPCYGLAEASLAVTMHAPGSPLSTETVSRKMLTIENTAVPVQPQAGVPTITVVDCGRPVPGMQVKIVNDNGASLSDAKVGRVWIKGPSVMQQFYNDPERTAELLHDGWLDTGDLGYLRNGRLFITGRRKELIIVRGQNVQPADLEWIAAEVPGVTHGRIVALGIYDEQAGSEQLHLVAEKPRGNNVNLTEIAEKVRQHVGRRTGIIPAQVALIPRNTIPRTTSGKLQRTQMKSIYTEQYLLN